MTLLYVALGEEGPGSFVQAHLKRAAATLRALDVPVEMRIQKGETPAGGILAAAREGEHDLIVVGNHGPQSRSIFSRDDVTLQVLARADRPVLVVPPDHLTP